MFNARLLNVFEQLPSGWGAGDCEPCMGHGRAAGGGADWSTMQSPWSRLGNTRSWGRGRRRVIGYTGLIAAIVIAVAVGWTALYGQGSGTSGGRGSRSTAPGGRSEPRIIAWIRDFGPRGGASGPHEGAYSDVLDPGCGGNDVFRSEDFMALADDKSTYSLYEGAASACLAAFQNRPDLWSRAESALNGVSANIMTSTEAPSTTPFDCLDRAVYRLFRSIVDLHKQDPGARFVRGSKATGSLPACPEVMRVVPNHGPSQGGYPVRLIGVNLHQGELIDFGINHLLTAQATNEHEAVVTAPPADPGEDVVSVKPRGFPFMAGGGAFFTYDPPSGSASPTGT